MIADTADLQQHNNVSYLGSHLEASLEFFGVTAAGPQIPFNTALVSAVGRIEEIRTTIAQLSDDSWLSIQLNREMLVLAEFYKRVIETCGSEHEFWYHPTGAQPPL